MPEFHAEPYIYLAGLSHKSALIAWGAFYFRTRSNGSMKIVDDHDLQWIHPPRCDSIGCRSKPYGPATVEITDESGALIASALTNDTNHVAIFGLKTVSDLAGSHCAVGRGTPVKKTTIGSSPFFSLTGTRLPVFRSAHRLATTIRAKPRSATIASRCSTTSICANGSRPRRRRAVRL